MKITELAQQFNDAAATLQNPQDSQPSPAEKNLLLKKNLAALNGALASLVVN